jgi:hypothetical protein
VWGYDWKVLQSVRALMTTGNATWARGDEKGRLGRCAVCRLSVSSLRHQPIGKFTVGTLWEYRM